MSIRDRFEHDEVSRLRLVIGRLGRRLRQEVEVDVTPSQLSALATLDCNGEVTIGELASIEHIRPPTMTRIIGALEEQGLVKRSQDPSDRRACRVSISNKGMDSLRRIRDARSAFLAERLAELDAADVELIRLALPALERLLAVEGGR